MNGNDIVWQVGECRVDLSTNEVTRAGDVAHLEPRSMEVLALLIRRAGEVVSRETLLDEVWGGVVVGDESLTNAIIKIRKALGDDARNPRFVETIPKRGYRLIAAIAPAVAQAVASPAPQAPRAAGRSSAPHLRALLRRAGLLLGALAIAALSWALLARRRRRSPNPQLHGPRLRPVRPRPPGWACEASPGSEPPRTWPISCRGSRRPSSTG